jgi:hypothetical protein
MHRTLNWVGWSVSDLARQVPFTEAVDEGLEWDPLAAGMKEWEQLSKNVKELREALHEGA